MKKSMKLMSMLLAVALVVAVLPTAAFAAEAEPDAELEAKIEELYDILPEDTEIFVGENGELNVVTSDASALFEKIMRENGIEPVATYASPVYAPEGGTYRNFGSAPGGADWPYRMVYMPKDLVDAYAVKITPTKFNQILDLIDNNHGSDAISAITGIPSPVIDMIIQVVRFSANVDAKAVVKAQEKSTTGKVLVTAMTSTTGPYNIYLPWNSNTVTNDYYPAAPFYRGVYDVL